MIALSFDKVTVRYGNRDVLHGVSAFTILLIGYVILLLGVMLRGV